MDVKNNPFFTPSLPSITTHISYTNTQDQLPLYHRICRNPPQPHRYCRRPFAAARSAAGSFPAKHGESSCQRLLTTKKLRE